MAVFWHFLIFNDDDERMRSSKWSQMKFQKNTKHQTQQVTTFFKSLGSLVQAINYFRMIRKHFRIISENFWRANYNTQNQYLHRNEKYSLFGRTYAKTRGFYNKILVLYENWKKQALHFFAIPPILFEPLWLFLMFLVPYFVVKTMLKN